MIPSIRAITLLIGSFLGTSSFSLAQAESTLWGTAQRILQRECLVCHGQVAISGLDLRNRESMLTGGQRGPALVPGNAEESLLFLAVSHSGELKMPPKNPPLPAEDLEALREWIDVGAPWGLVTASHSEPGWWSLRRPRRPPGKTWSGYARSGAGLSS